MTVLKRIRTEDGDVIEVCWNGTSLEFHSNKTNRMVRPETLIEILEENNNRVFMEKY